VDSYTERLLPSWWLTLVLGLFLPAGFIIFLPLDPVVGLTAGAGMWAGAWGVLAVFSPTVSATREGFRAGAARIEWSHVSQVDVVSKDEARAAKGVNLDARAWLVMRPWIKPAVRIHIRDVDDPTPYWLVSTTQPEVLRDVCLKHLAQI
jgi:hypothetical protein